MSSPPPPLTIPEALEVFVGGFCFVRSFTRPYVAERLGGLWVLRDAPAPGGNRSRGERKREVIAHYAPPAEVVRAIRAAAIPWHFVCHVHGTDGSFQEVRAAYKALGYRAIATEWLFAHHLAEVPELAATPPVRRVRSEGDAERLRRARRGRRAIRREDLGAERPAQRLYAAMDDREVYGWVSSVPVGRHAWVADLMVRPEHRGRGFGRALMSALLLDDRAQGVASSVLLASSDGARLYPHLGYRQIGVLQMFAPRRGSA
jgi:GNAT superfamily N-acetyltransferase